MGLLDITRVVRSPRFSKRITVERRESTVSSQGLVTITTVTLTPVGSIQAGNSQAFLQSPDLQSARTTITVYCYQERLFDQVTAHQPDFILHLGNRYQVKKVNDWTLWGPGWCVAECELFDMEVADA